MTYEQIRLEFEGAIASLVLARPDARNAMTADMAREIERALEELNARADVRVVLVRGDGQSFAAGGDFKMIEERTRATPEENRAEMRRFYGAFLAIRRLRVPTIAVVHGAAVGAGLCFAMACDIRLAATGAKLGANFVRIGLHPGMGASWLLPRLCGPAKAAELLLTGKLIDADEACRIGLVNEVYPPESLLPMARRMAEEIAQAAPIAVAQTKASLWADRTLEQALASEAEAQSADFQTADMAEGIRAFYEKRAPKFEGR